MYIYTHTQLYIHPTPLYPFISLLSYLFNSSSLYRRSNGFSVGLFRDPSPKNLSSRTLFLRSNTKTNLHTFLVHWSTRFFGTRTGYIFMARPTTKLHHLNQPRLSLVFSSAASWRDLARCQILGSKPTGIRMLCGVSLRLRERR